MSFKRIILLGVLALGALGLGLTAAIVGGLCLAFVGVARWALRGSQPEPKSVLPAPRTGRELSRVRRMGADEEANRVQVSVRRYHPR